jgi:hypothetical protein
MGMRVELMVHFTGSERGRFSLTPEIEFRDGALHVESLTLSQNAWNGCSDRIDPRLLRADFDFLLGSQKSKNGGFA